MVWSKVRKKRLNVELLEILNISSRHVFRSNCTSVNFKFTILEISVNDGQENHVEEKKVDPNFQLEKKCSVSLDFSHTGKQF